MEGLEERLILTRCQWCSVSQLSADNEFFFVYTTNRRGMFQINVKQTIVIYLHVNLTVVISGSFQQIQTSFLASSDAKYPFYTNFYLF